MISRRSLLASSAAGFAIHAAPSQTEVAVDWLEFGYEDYLYRAPLKFGGALVDRVTLLNVNVTIRAKDGRRAQGFGSMSMGNVWAFPSKTLKYDQTLGAMKELATKIGAITRGFKDYAHPIDINVTLEPEYLKAAAAISKTMTEPIPKLCTLVTASPFDAAIHDAYGKLLGRSAYQIYGPDCMRHDLSRYLGPEFKGEYLDRYVLKAPKPSMPLYHLVGAVDPIDEADIAKRLNDGLPETLPEWIKASGLDHIKIKLNGDDLKWDVERVVRVERTTAPVQATRGVAKWAYSLDFNEKCPNIGYLMDFLHQVKEKAPAAFDRVQYIEQPTRRDLQADRANVMHEASKLRPVVIDESLTDQESLMLAREMGYTGTALKACKGQAQALLMAALAQKKKMFLCVQDLTCPGASLLHSAGLAAHVPGVAAIEANARQYVPAANAPWVRKFPGIFDVRDGRINTGLLNGLGLSVV